MKVLLVACEFTHTPHNYTHFYRRVLASGLISHTLLLKYISPQHVYETAGLFAAGASRFGRVFLRNTAFSLLKGTQRLHDEMGISYTMARNPNSDRTLNWIRQEKFDLIVNARTMAIYKEPLLSAPRLGCINLHHGILPLQRGLLCDLHALARGDDLGFSIHLMEREIDAGPIYWVEKVPYEGRDYFEYLSVCELKEATALIRFLSAVKKDGALPQGKLNHAEAYHYSRPIRTLGEMRALVKQNVGL